MRAVSVGVYEIELRIASSYANYNELDIFVVCASLNVLAVCERLECFSIWNTHGAIGYIDRRCANRVFRYGTHADWVFEFCNVVNAISIDVSGISNEEFFHQVSLFGQCGQILGQQRRAVSTQSNQDRNFHHRVTQIMPYVKHEVFINRRLYFDWDGCNPYRGRGWVIAASGTRLWSLLGVNRHGRGQGGQQCHRSYGQQNMVFFWNEVHIFGKIVGYKSLV